MADALRSSAEADARVDDGGGRFHAFGALLGALWSGVLSGGVSGGLSGGLSGFIMETMHGGADQIGHEDGGARGLAGTSSSVTGQPGFCESVHPPTSVGILCIRAPWHEERGSSCFRTFILIKGDDATGLWRIKGERHESNECQ